MELGDEFLPIVWNLLLLMLLDLCVFELDVWLDRAMNAVAAWSDISIALRSAS